GVRVPSSNNYLLAFCKYLNLVIIVEAVLESVNDLCERLVCAQGDCPLRRIAEAHEHRPGLAKHLAHKLFDILRGVRVIDVNIESDSALGKNSRIAAPPSADFLFAGRMLCLPLGNKG